MPNISKTRNWAFVVYPESAPEAWQELLEDTRIPSFVSPLHDRDVDEDGNVKKPHYHVVIMMDGPITPKRANEIIEPFCGTKSAEYIKSLRGYVRYLAHLDNPDKAQYDITEIVALNGADLGKYLKPEQIGKNQLLGEIVLFCKEEKIYEASDLAQYALNNREDWFQVITEKSYFINMYLTSLRHSMGSKG
jgi:hypothetical protein